MKHARNIPLLYLPDPDPIEWDCDTAPRIPAPRTAGGRASVQRRRGAAGHGRMKNTPYRRQQRIRKINPDVNPVAVLGLKQPGTSMAARADHLGKALCVQCDTTIRASLSMARKRFVVNGFRRYGA